MTRVWGSLVGLAILVLARSALAEAPDPALAKALLEKVDAANGGFRDVALSLRFRLVEAGGKVRERRLKVLFLGERRLVRFLAPADFAGTEILIEGPGVMYVYTPEGHRVRRLGAHFETQGLFGGDAGLRELQEELTFGHSYEPTLVSADDKTAVLELRPKPGAKGVHARLVMRIDRVSGNFTKLDYYGADGKRFKQQARAEYQPSGIPGVLTPRRIVFLSFLKNTATEVFIEGYQHNVGTPESLFKVKNLGRGTW